MNLIVDIGNTRSKFFLFDSKDEIIEKSIFMNQDEKKLIEMCSQFAKRADALEKRAFHNGEYKLKQFVPDFNRLFDIRTLNFDCDNFTRK